MQFGKIRVNKYLAQQGVAARRKADQLILEGRVGINGRIAKLGEKVDPKGDQITVDGKTVLTEVKLIYVVLNKPKGVITTTSDEFNRPKVTDLIPSAVRLFPVGRLDENSRGLILLTNDGKLSQQLSHPSQHMSKTYQLLIQGRVSEQQLEKLRNGILLKEGKTLPTKTEVLSYQGNRTKLEIILFEGRNRQIRRMCAKLNLQLLDLKRVAIGPVTLDNLKEGAYRLLTTEEIRLLLLDNPLNE